MTLTRSIALDALATEDLLGLGMEADAVRRALHPVPAATYIVSAAAAAYCSGQHDSSAAEDPFAAADAILDHGGCDLILGAMATLDEAEATLRALAARHPGLSVHGFSAEDILRWSAPSAHGDTLSRLRDAGLQSLGAGAALVLDDPIRAGLGVSSSADWLAVHRTAHQVGLPTFAALVIGLGETPESRIAHLAALRDLEADAPGFAAFTLSVHHDLARREEEATAADYLKTLATARLLLENIAHVGADWSVQGPKILELALRFGADDAGAVPPRHNDPAPAHHSGEAELRRLLRDAGFRPTPRDLLYRQCLLA
jgi:cyclic dehypoxanthinyl futalosine synthase